MSEFKDKYQNWLNELAAMFKEGRQQQLDNLMSFADTIKAFYRNL
jgi:hypothetical protein